MFSLKTYASILENDITANNNISTFWFWCFQPQFVSKKVENLRICGPVFEFFWQKKNFLAKKIVFDDVEAFLHDFDFTKIIGKFSAFFENKKPQKGFKIVKNFFFAKFTFFCQKNRKKFRKSLSFRLFWKQIEARNISIKK